MDTNISRTEEHELYKMQYELNIEIPRKEI